jgi:inorganic triphosphatase YgiF
MEAAVADHREMEATVADHLEIEQKFDVDEDFERPDFGALADALHEGITAATPVRHHLAATYFDTPDARLAANKITLRRRTGGTDEGWHLKLPEGLDTRRELRAPLDGHNGPDSEVPERLAGRVADVTGGLPLAPIAVLDTERTVVTLTGHDGRVLAEVADDLVTARRLGGSGGAAAGQPLRWREIEVEVPAASSALQKAAADLLRAAGARPGGHSSKLARLLDR